VGARQRGRFFPAGRVQRNRRADERLECRRALGRSCGLQRSSERAVGCRTMMPVRQTLLVLGEARTRRQFLDKSLAIFKNKQNQ
jgi:hypothetical protein